MRRKGCCEQPFFIALETAITPILPFASQGEAPCERPYCLHPASSSSAECRRRFQPCCCARDASSFAARRWEHPWHQARHDKCASTCATGRRATQAKPFRCRPDVALLNRTCVIAPIGDVTGKNPFPDGRSAFVLPVHQHGSEVWAQRKFIFRALGLEPADPSARRLHFDLNGNATKHVMTP